MKFKRHLVIGAVALSVCASAITVVVDGKPVAFPVGQPFETKGKVLVPIRGVFEKLGGEVNWDQASHLITITKGDMTLKVTIGEDHALKNEETVVMGARSVNRGGTAYVPLRFFAETLDADVVWEGENQTVRISTQKAVTAPSKQNNPPPPFRR